MNDKLEKLRSYVEPDEEALALIDELEAQVSIDEVRKAVADYIGSEGCACCEGSDHKKHQDKLGELLGVPLYDDGSGYDFSTIIAPPKGGE